MRVPHYPTCTHTLLLLLTLGSRPIDFYLPRTFRRSAGRGAAKGKGNEFVSDTIRERWAREGRIRAEIRRSSNNSNLFFEVCYNGEYKDPLQSNHLSHASRRFKGKTITRNVRGNSLIRSNYFTTTIRHNLLYYFPTVTATNHWGLRSSRTCSSVSRPEADYAV